MTTVQRRFNSTGRRRIPRSKIDIALERAADLSVTPSARARLNLDDLLNGRNIPGDAIVAIEAYYRTSSMRFACGTVANLMPPERMVLSDIDKGGAVRFRVLVIAPDGSGRILAAADGLRPSSSDNGADRQALLPMRETDISNELWKIEVDYRTGPVLLVNNRVPGLAAQIRKDPLLQGLILPHAFRAILQNLNPNGESDDDDLWGDNWRRFLVGLGVPTEADEPDDPDSVEEWIESAVKVFSDIKEFAERVKLYEHPEAHDGSQAL
jgi:hypothetical protein